MEPVSATNLEGGHPASYLPVRRFQIWSLIILLLAVPEVIWAISLFDVIRMAQAGYSDRDIIKLIDVTQARFQVDAEAIVSLKEAGVSEKVIQALIEVSPPAHQPTQTPPSHRDSRAGDTSRAPGPDLSRGHKTETADAGQPRPSGPAPLFPEGPFSAYPFVESRLGHAYSHHHYALAVRDLPILILRSEAGYPTIADRAKEITTLLNQMIYEQPDGYFFASSEPTASVWYRSGTSDQALPIVTVERGDVIAYQRRSLGVVSSDRLAAYWSALLNDFTQLLVFRREPSHLMKLHLGEPLSRIYDEIHSPTAVENQSSIDEATMMLKVFDHLTGEDKEHLLELATRVPVEFQENREVLQ